MTKTSTNPDITIRGGVINVPHPTTPTRPPRHQPNTPRTKKDTTTRSDHQIPAADSPTPVKDSPPTPAEPSAPPPDEPETDSPD